jgi:hypothetical protein
MSNISGILNQLQSQRRQVHQELVRLDSAISALKGLAVPNHTGKASGASSRPRRTMSTAARKRIAAAQRARWAAWKAKQKKVA